jgi:peptidoglycan hydrolase-like protein with peptidoglycan-binding domain
MRRILIVLSLLLALAPVAAEASFDTSKQWYERLPESQRSSIQTDLILLGHYDFLIDGQFGRATFDAIADFQKSQGGAASGVLSPAELQAMRALAESTQQRLGMRRVSDQPAHASLIIPANLLTRRTPTEQGTSYVSADGEISLETMHATLADQSFRDLFDTMTAPDPERTVTYRSFGDARFVVSGMIGEYSFYTVFLASGDEAVGYSLAWGKRYATDGAISSIWLASHFSPLASLPSDPDTKFAGDSGNRASAFDLPPGEPDVISLNAEITRTTPTDLDRALDARPKASILVLNSPGGAVDSALVIAQEVRRRGMRTYVPDGMGCYSACAYIFFAGENRIADGELGVHQISQDMADIVLTQITIGDILDALDEFGVQHRVISHMLRTPPEDMYVFSRLELSDLDINRGEPIRVAISTDEPVSEPEAHQGVPTAFVQLSSQSSRTEADRSLTYSVDRWGKLFGDARPEVDAAPGEVFRVRVPLTSVERANSICAAIKADGGGCYVTMAGG